MDDQLIRALGDELYAALRSRSTLAPLTERHPAVTIEDAYRISSHLLQRRLIDGERLIGKKIGVTSAVVQQALNVHQPDFGFLTDRMSLPDGAVISLSERGLIQPRAEGELAFVLARDLGTRDVTPEQVLEATQYVLPCFEIVDSRIRDWQIAIQDTIADNASCAVFVTGRTTIRPGRLDLAAVELELHRNGSLAATGLGAAALGHPAAAVAWLANTLGRFGVALHQGEIILSGSLVPLIPVGAGDFFELFIDGMPFADVRFVD